MFNTFPAKKPHDHLHFFLFYDRNGDTYEAMYDEKENDWEIVSLIRDDIRNDI